MPFPRADAEVDMSRARRRVFAFTLIELLVVILIGAVLMGLAFPVFQGVMNSAKKTQAKNDLTQIVTAVNAFYTEYGRYPTTATSDATATYGPANSNRALFDELRAVTSAMNTRQIVFLSPPDAKDGTNPRGGIAPSTSANAGQYFDPWGIAYSIRLDWDYDNQVANPYTANAGNAPLRSGVIAWSFGQDKASQTLPGPAPDKNTGTNKDDVISWQ
ncbi:MAG TPA: prepilin-type N-terminal cleavage/methylation domain-containing protein [Chthoniobacterales bacterium]